MTRSPIEVEDGDELDEESIWERIWGICDGAEEPCIKVNDSNWGESNKSSFIKLL